MWTHWVARSNHPYEPFREFQDSRIAWLQLTAQFPEMLAAVLMPNHLHLILPESAESQAIRRRLHGFLGSVSRRCQVATLWQPVPAGARIPDRQHLRRTIRYVALNPCRKSLCRDPIEWYWSTYREVLGATVESTQTRALLADAFGDTRGDFAERFHRYVSADQTVNNLGTPLPKRVAAVRWSEHSIMSVLAASAAALRVPVSEVKRRGPLRPLFIHLAARQGWHRPALLAEICGITASGVHKILAQPMPPGIAPAELCLADARLRSQHPRPEVRKMWTKRLMGGGR